MSTLVLARPVACRSTSRRPWQLAAASAGSDFLVRARSPSASRSASMISAGQHGADQPALARRPAALCAAAWRPASCSSRRRFGDLLLRDQPAARARGAGELRKPSQLGLAAEYEPDRRHGAGDDAVPAGLWIRFATLLYALFFGRGSGELGPLRLDRCSFRPTACRSWSIGTLVRRYRSRCCPSPSA